MDDKTVKKSELVVDSLQYAHDHDLDINILEDVQKILDALDTEHKENVAEFAELLKTSETYMNMKASEKTNNNLSN